MLLPVFIMPYDKYHSCVSIQEMVFIIWHEVFDYRMGCLYAEWGDVNGMGC